MKFLEVNQLSFSYSEEKRPFHGLSFVAEKRGIYFIQGKSGIGKSTLALLLSGHLKPNAGEIWLNGQKILGPSPRSFLVSQEEDLFPWMKIGEQLEFFRRLSPKSPRAFTDFDISSCSIKDALSLVDLADAQDLYPHQLSGGMKKRVSLLRGTILRPELLLLDETFSSIELDLRTTILSRLQPIWESTNTGVFVVSHDPLPVVQFPLSGTWLL